MIGGNALLFTELPETPGIRTLLSPDDQRDIDLFRQPNGCLLELIRCAAHRTDGPYIRGELTHFADDSRKVRRILRCLADDSYFLPERQVGHLRRVGYHRHLPTERLHSAHHALYFGMPAIPHEEHLIPLLKQPDSGSMDPGNERACHIHDA